MFRFSVTKGGKVDKVPWLGSTKGPLLVLAAGVIALTGMALCSTRSAILFARSMVSREVDLALLAEGDVSLHDDVTRFFVARWWNSYLPIFLISALLLAMIVVVEKRGNPTGR